MKVLPAIAFSIFNLVAATGEEFAWCGLLQGQFTREFGVLSGIMFQAAIWWAWHLPGLLLGYNFPEYPYFGALVLFPSPVMALLLMCFTHSYSDLSDHRS